MEKENKPKKKKVLKILLIIAAVILVPIVGFITYVVIAFARTGYFSNNYSPDELDIDCAELPEWEVVSNLNTSDITYNDDGSIIFSAKGPNGEDVRFLGRDVDISEGKIVIHQQGTIMMVDSIGRIYGAIPYIPESNGMGDWLQSYCAYNLNLDPHPGNLDYMVYGLDTCRMADDYMDQKVKERCYDYALLQPNFVGIGAVNISNPQGEAGNNGDLTVTAFYIRYEPSEECTKIAAAFFDREFHNYGLEGEKYRKATENYDPEKGDYSFYLMGIPELLHVKEPIPVEQYQRDCEAGMPQNIVGLSLNNYYEVVGIKDKDGNERPTDNATLKLGDELMVKLGVQTLDVPLDVMERYYGLNTQYDCMPYCTVNSIGEVKTLVIPIAWKDEPENATDVQLDMFKAELGRVIADDGSVTDYSDKLTDRYSLSSYFDEASYGNLKVSSYMTDWYQTPYDFSEYRNRCVDEDFFEETLDWLYKTYPNLDYESFDKNKDGYFDSVIFLNAGSIIDGNYNIISFEGGISHSTTCGNEYANTPQKPAINLAITVNAYLLDDNTLIHEFGHQLGLIDYYDVRYSGVDAVGGYDMQSQSSGDWNAYSKYSVGWITPQIVDNLALGESVDIEIGAMSATGDCIVIPAVGSDFDGVFSEYMMVDLYSDCGVNKYDCTKRGFELDNFEGVRIYHVDSVLEKHEHDNPDFPDMIPNIVGSVHFANQYKADGFYNIELIQAGAKNTFTVLGDSLRARIEKEDFFKAGDKFTLSKYKEFFTDGKMDDGNDFGYSIEVVSIEGKGENAKAVIRITRE